jgi:hypothetical protein
MQAVVTNQALQSIGAIFRPREHVSQIDFDLNQI